MAGDITEFPSERMVCDAKLTEIGEGISEVQRMVIARELLGFHAADEYRLLAVPDGPVAPPL